LLTSREGERSREGITLVGCEEKIRGLENKKDIDEDGGGLTLRGQESEIHLRGRGRGQTIFFSKTVTWGEKTALVESRARWGNHVVLNRKHRWSLNSVVPALGEI